MRMSGQLWMLHFLCCVVSIISLTPDTCFYFPQTHFETRGSPTTVHFNVNKTCSSTIDNFNFEITKTENCSDHGPKSVSFCLELRLGTNKGNCSCKDTGSCFAVTTFHRWCGVQWKIEPYGGRQGTDSQKELATVISFVVTFPPKLDRFYATSLEAIDVGSQKSYLVTEGTNTELVCKWEKGHSKGKVIIRHDSKTLKSDEVTPASEKVHISHRLDPIDCGDTGNYTCEVEGTDSALSFTLLVKCALKFSVRGLTPMQTVEPGWDAIFAFNITSYIVPEICTLATPESPTEKVSCNGTRRDVRVTGSPPYFTVYVIVTKATKDDTGLWNITMSNGVGDSAAQSFHLAVQRSTTTLPTPRHTTTTTTVTDTGDDDDDDDDDGKDKDKLNGADKKFPWLYVGVGAACFVVVVVVVAFVVCCCVAKSRKKKQRQKQSRTAVEPNRKVKRQDFNMTVNEFYETSEACVLMPNTIYEGSGDLTNAVDDGLYSTCNKTTQNSSPTAPAPNHGAAAPEMDGGQEYVTQEQIQRNKMDRKKKKTGNNIAPEMDGGQEYVTQEQIQRNKMDRKKKKTGNNIEAAASASAAAGSAGDNEYVTQEQIQKNKRKRKKKTANNNTDPKPEGEATLYSDARS